MLRAAGGSPGPLRLLSGAATMTSVAAVSPPPDTATRPANLSARRRRRKPRYRSARMRTHSVVALERVAGRHQLLIHSAANVGTPAGR